MCLSMAIVILLADASIPAPRNSGGGGGRFSEFQLDFSPTEVKVPYSDAKSSGVATVKSIQFPNIDKISDVQYQVPVLANPEEEESDSNPSYDTMGKLVRLDVGKSGENIGKPVGIFSVSRRESGLSLSQEVEVPYEKIRGEVINGIQAKYSKKEDQGSAMDLISRWEKKVESEVLTEDYDEQRYVDVFDELVAISKSDKTSKEKTEAFQKILGNGVKYTSSPTNDIVIGGKSYALHSFFGNGEKEAIIEEIYSLEKPQERKTQLKKAISGQSPKKGILD